MAMYYLEIPTENLLKTVLQMPEKEFEEFVEKAIRLRQELEKSDWTKSEVELIKKVNECQS